MRRYFLLLLLAAATVTSYSQSTPPLRIGIAGLTHTHVHGLLSRAKNGDIEIVGIAEPNRDLARRYLDQYQLPLTLLYDSLDEMIDKTRPEAVAAFNSIYGHLEVVQRCAPRGIHVMVEKPLAASLDHARKMQALAQQYGIYLLTNYETTWYGSNYKALELLDSIGGLRKLVVHDGHQGPKEIGVNKEFLDWLTDPVLNGGGALMDFGCYGANLLTVFAVTQQIKPDVYPNVEDEATIVVTYPKAQGIIQASWNWPYNRKDMEVYGRHGYMIADRNGLKVKPDANAKEQLLTPSLQPPFHEPFAYLAAVIRGRITPQPYDLSSLENNMLVMEILDAAKRSAKEGKRIELGKP